MEELSNHRPKRAKPNKDYDDNKTSEIDCDHNLITLKECGEKSYFEEKYLKKKSKDKSCQYATHCKRCKGAIRDKVNFGDMVGV